MLGAVPILYAPYATLSSGDITFKITQMGGVSALFIGAILIMSGIGIWLNPNARVYIGIFVILVSLVSFVVATFGGFFIGMLLGLIGGTLAISWVFTPATDEDTEERSDDDDEGDTGGEAKPADTLVEEGFLAQALDRKDPDASGEAPAGPETARPGDTTRTAASPRMALTAIVTAMVGVVGVVGIAHASPSDPLPDIPYADGPCVSASPTASPSASGSASAKPSTASGKPSASKPAAKAPEPTTQRAPAIEDKATTSTAPVSKTSEPKLPELKLPELKLPEIKIPGLELPGIKLPSAASSAPAVASAPATQVAPTGSAAGTPSVPTSAPPTTASGKPSAKPTTTSAKPSATSSSAAPKDGKSPFPCPIKGPVNAKDGSGLPSVAVDPWVLRSNLLAMAGLNYEGVVKVKTRAGVEENALKFTVSKGIDIWNLSMTVREESGKDVEITARAGSKSWMEADVPTTMYVKYLKGNIFGIIPITFTPESPPPINVPIVFFTNVESALYAQLGGRMHIPGYGFNKDHKPPQ